MTPEPIDRQPESAVVITPSIGRSQLSACIESVQQQDFPLVEHIVVSDGAKYSDGVNRAVEAAAFGRHPIHACSLMENTGGIRYHGYRICAAFSYLVNADIVLFLDDDNWYDPGHISSCIAAMKEFRTQWAYSLRRICRHDGTFLVNDDCDSVGHWRRDASYGGPANLLAQRFIDFYSTYPFLVDTNCFAIRRTLLTEMAGLLLDGDSFFSTHLIRTFAGACTGERTVNYRIPEGKERLRFEYFDGGNRSMLARYLSEYPWIRRQRREPLSLVRTDLAIGHQTESRNTGADNRKCWRHMGQGIPQHPDRRPL